MFERSASSARPPATAMTLSREMPWETGKGPWFRTAPRRNAERSRKYAASVSSDCKISVLTSSFSDREPIAICCSSLSFFVTVLRF